MKIDEREGELLFDFLDKWMKQRSSNNMENLIEAYEQIKKAHLPPYLSFCESHESLAYANCKICQEAMDLGSQGVINPKCKITKWFKKDD